MQKREYIIDGSNITKLADFVVIFAGFSVINTKNSPAVVYNQDIDSWIQERLRDDDNLDRFNDYLTDMIKPMDWSIGPDDCILIRILNSGHLRNLFSWERTKERFQRILSRYKTLYPNDSLWIGHIELQIKAVENQIRGTSLFDDLMLMILSKKKIRLQLE